MYKQNPFGNPDGARADLKEIEYSFITDFPFGIQITKNQDELLNKRVIVGSKGSGKTVYLRKIQSILKKELENNFTGIYVDERIDKNLNCTEWVVTFCDFFEKNALSEKWTRLWKTSILLSISHKFLYDEKLKIYVTEDTGKLLKSIIEKHKLLLKCSCSVYQMFSTIMSVLDTKNKINNLIYSADIIQIENILQNILRNSPTIYIFLDSIDIEYEHAPMQWLSCQKGLFYAIMTFLEEGTFGEKVHLIISLRDNVFTNILRSEHASKFINETHIFILDWKESNIRAFLSQKIGGLNSCYFVEDAPQSKNIYSWLGIRELPNELGQTEEITDFILRHTRLTPRDVIVVCNKLAELKKEYSNNKNLDIKKWVKDVVIANSKLFGAEMITICAKNINANCLPSGAGKDQYSDFYLMDKFFKKSTYTQLLNLLKTLKSRKINWDVLCKFNELAIKEFNTDVHLIDLLWNNGIIGCSNHDGDISYYAQQFQEDTLIPENKEAYQIRSCVCVKIGLNELN
ncbi:MAG: hypothetical protein IJZ75_03970 [Clostridia bacterium]|nr:hypothetical protein [Clostridia bacterium]